MQSTSNIRLPAVAGSFYSDDPDTLANDVDRFVDSPNAAMSAVRVLVSPHAGYVYSGAIAGPGFRRVRSSPRAPSRAFIVGPSHVEPFAYTSVFGGSAYRTPLGDVAVDARAARQLAAGDGSIRISGAGHDTARHARGEHALEVQLPFLQRAFPGMTIVPIVMGSQSWEACAALGSAIAAVVDWSGDIVIASSDLSHFHDDRRARELDAIFCATFLTLDPRALHDRIARRECEACGAGPVVAALLATPSLRNRRAEVVAAGNSGDVNRDRSSVVGYLSGAVTGDAA